MNIDEVLVKAQDLHEDNQEFFKNMLPNMENLTLVLGEDFDGDVMEHLNLNICIAITAYDAGATDALVNLAKISCQSNPSES